MTDLQRTPLYEAHVSLGARIVPFAGYEMPVSYSGIIEEHRAVRERVGLFDVSHMGEFRVTGPDTWEWLNQVVTNDVNRLDDGAVLYTVMCRDDGTTVDDLLISRLGPERALIVVNAANIAKDYAHMSSLLHGNVRLDDHSERYALIAVQGPSALELMCACPAFVEHSAALCALDYYHVHAFDSGGIPFLVSRTGYTGERGFEVFVPPASAAAVWRELLSVGERFGVMPIGLAARDTLRFEAAFCLYGHELDDTTTPMQAGLKWLVRFKKGPFTGRDALARERDRGVPRRLVGLELEGRNIARQGFDILAGGKAVGRVTSGSFAPTLQRSVALAYVDSAVPDDVPLAVGVRNKAVPAQRVAFPFYPSRAATPWEPGHG